MKRKLFAICLLSCLFVACKSDKKEQKQPVQSQQEQSTQIDNDGSTVLIGEFIYTPKAAVINGDDFIYGVVLDSMAKTLAQKVDTFKQGKYEMVPVVIKGKISPNPVKNGWDEVVKITKIIKISKPKQNTNSAIRINSDQKKI